jgi:hypothetical protein
MTTNRVCQSYAPPCTNDVSQTRTGENAHPREMEGVEGWGGEGVRLKWRKREREAAG